MAHNHSSHDNDSMFELVNLVEDFNYIHPKGVELWPACLLPFLIIPGLFCNILAFAILVKRQMCLEHEGFVYLAAIQLINIAVLAYDVTPFWVSSFSQSNNVLITSDASCKALIHLDHVLSSASGWLVVAMLFNVYLRRRLQTDTKVCGCTEFPAKYCTLFGAGFATGSIFFQLVVGCLWLIPFTQFIDKEFIQYCHIDLPPSYALWVFVIERLPILVLTPVLLIAVAYVALGRGDIEVSFNALEESTPSSNVQDFSKTSTWVATASVLLKAPIFITKSVLPRDISHHWLRFDVIFFSLNTLSHVNLVVMPIVCLATLSGMREVIASVTGGKCSECRCARRVTT